MSEREKGHKPLGGKSYGSIPHLIGSKVGEGDHTVHEGQHRICTEKTRDRHDMVIVQEKYDGSNVGVARVGGELIALVRAGYTAESSPFEQHHYFAEWVDKNRARFEFIAEGERLCGEWLAQAHGLKYLIYDEPFVAFDYIAGKARMPYGDFVKKVEDYDFHTPRLLAVGNNAVTIEWALRQLNKKNGAWIRADGELPEGVVYRVERKGLVDFLAKFVRKDFPTGQYLSDISGLETVWNIDPTKI